LARIDSTATTADVRAACLQSGHLRIPMLEAGRSPWVVHVRDTLCHPDDQPATKIARPAFALPAQTPVYEALGRMRRSSVQLAIVMDDKKPIGIVTLTDVLKYVLQPGVSDSEVRDGDQVAR
jgi:CBS domain containing-hemolysin-like protein